MSGKTTIKIEFDSPEAARHFATWLCESGEQDYWLWMEYREQEENGPITATDFDYHNAHEVNGKKMYGKFMKDNTIRTTCGRLIHSWAWRVLNRATSTVDYR